MLLHWEEPAIAQNDTETKTPTRSFAHEWIINDALRYIVGIVIDGLAIVGGYGLKHAIAHALTVDIEFM